MPLPLPGLPALTCSQDALAVALQPQPGTAVTVAVAPPPAAPKACVVGATLNVHGVVVEMRLTLPFRSTT